MANGNEGSTTKDIESVRAKINGTENGGTPNGGKTGNTSPATTSGGATESGGSTGIEIKKISEVPILNLPTPPKKKRPSPQPKDTPLDKSLESNVAMLLTTGFEFSAIRLGEHWRVSDEEVKAISEPATRILQRLGINESASKYMDYFALLAGLGMVIVPRVLISQAISKGDIQNEKPVNQPTSTNNSNKKRPTKTVSKPTTTSNNSDNSNVSDFKAFLGGVVEQA